MSKNHTNVLYYPYSFFKTCLKVANEQDRLQIAGMCNAIGIALSGDEQSYLELIEDGPNA